MNELDVGYMLSERTHVLGSVVNLQVIVHIQGQVV